jgi:hypothetical protein
MRTFFNEIDHETPPVKETGGCLTKNVVKHGVKNGVKIYAKYVMYSQSQDFWMVRSVKYSLDQQSWTDDFVEMIREIKRLGY